MSLLDTLVDEVESHLAGYTARVERAASLADDIPASGAAVVQVDVANVMAVGILQVDDELMQVVSFDGTSGVVPAWGRGVGGSNPVAHTTGAKVTMSPLFPRARVKSEIQQVVLGLWPELFGVGKISLDVGGAVQTYALPTGTEDILRVTTQEPGPSGTWSILRSWRFSKTADLTTYPTGRTLTIPMLGWGSRKVDVLTKVRPVIFEATETWEEMGLYPSAQSAVVYGTLHRLLNSVDYGRLDPLEAAATQEGRPVLAASELARQTYALYRQMLADERDRMLEAIQPSMYFEG